jgi:CubicO group peptidase (beta-lactamase class C family)
LLTFFGLVFGWCLSLAAQGTPDFSGIDTAVNAAIAKGDVPGAVVLVVHKDKVVFRKAYGQRAKLPSSLPMTEDTVFDLASLTKPIATATSIMLLMEQGKLRLSDRVARHFPGFEQNGKGAVTVEHLLLHTSGLIADNDVADYRDGKARALERIFALKPTAEPGAKFTYSDVNYIVLGELVEKLSGATLDRFSAEHIFVPLAMRTTRFLPTDEMKKRAAPTEHREERWMIGEVHDPRAYLLGGVAGHAGLFSTADDLALYARMVLHGGELDGNRVLSSDTVRTMTTPRTVPGGLRAYGWDVDTRFSSNRGDLFPRGRSFGHTGFTGTSIWIDPVSQTAVIFLSNRVHPEAKVNINRLRGQVATAAAGTLGLKK